jgi:hypothetical protein
VPVYRHNPRILHVVRRAASKLANIRSSIADKRSARANRIAADLAPIIGELRAAGLTSLNGIAAALDRRHVPTPGGSGHWHAAQVSRLLKRLAARARWTTNP